MNLQEAFDAGFEAVKAYVESGLQDFERRLVEIESRAPVRGEKGEDGKDGASVSEAHVAALIAAEVGKAIAAMPAPKDGVNGKDGINGKDGASISIDDVLPLIADGITEQVTKAVSAIPVPVNGKDGVDGINGKDGTNVTVDDVLPLITEHVTKAIAAIPVPRDGFNGKDGVDGKDGSNGLNGKDGVALAGAIIDRAGDLVVTLSDGSTRELGPVVGNDVDMAQVDRSIAERVALIPRPKDGVDGLGFDDMDLVDTDDGFVLRFTRGDVVKEFPLPVPTDRGVWVDKEHKKGAGVTLGGSFWIAKRDTRSKPDTPEAKDDWRLAVKRGRDGKDFRPEQPRDPSPVKFK
ncbi:MAG: hypothetical protein JWL86_5397 [Rhizobium sp.]|nr:hypothetical protein [Rhizobium sp.]